MTAQCTGYYPPLFRCNCGFLLCCGQQGLAVQIAGVRVRLTLIATREWGLTKWDWTGSREWFTKERPLVAKPLPKQNPEQNMLGLSQGPTMLLLHPFRWSCEIILALLYTVSGICMTPYTHGYGPRLRGGRLSQLSIDFFFLRVNSILWTVFDSLRQTEGGQPFTHPASATKTREFQALIFQLSELLSTRISQNLVCSYEIGNY